MKIGFVRQKRSGRGREVKCCKKTVVATTPHEIKHERKGQGMGEPKREVNNHAPQKEGWPRA